MISTENIVLPLNLKHKVDWQITSISRELSKNKRRECVKWKSIKTVVTSSNQFLFQNLRERSSQYFAEEVFSKFYMKKNRSKILATRDLDRAIYTQTETQTYRHTDRACSGLYYIYIYYFINILIWLNIKITFLWFHVWPIWYFCEA